MPGSSAHDEELRRQYLARKAKRTEGMGAGNADVPKPGRGGRCQAPITSGGSVSPTRAIGFCSGSESVDRAVNSLPNRKEAYPITPIDIFKANGYTEPVKVSRWAKVKSTYYLFRWLRRRKPVAEPQNGSTAIVDFPEYSSEKNHNRGVDGAKTGVVAGLTGWNAAVYSLIAWVRAQNTEFLPWPHDADIAISTIAGGLVGTIVGYVTGRVANYLRYAKDKKANNA